MTRSYSAHLAQTFRSNGKRLPLLVSLRSRGRIDNVEELIFSHLREYSPGHLTVHGVRFLLRTKPIVLFLDGLDEIGIQFPSGATINHLVNLSALIETYPDMKTVITARTHYFRDEEEIAHLWGEEIEIASQLGTQRLSVESDKCTCCFILPFDDMQKESFLRKVRPKDADRLIQHFPRLQPALWDLAARPILFKMILDSIDDAGGNLDWDNQTAIYRQYTNKWLIRDEYRGVMSIGLKKTLTEYLARKLWSTDVENIHWRELMKFISQTSTNLQLPKDKDVEAIANEMRTASFLISGDEGLLSFAHTSFLEYFLACYIVTNIKKDAFAVLQDKPLSELTLRFLSDLLNSNMDVVAALDDMFSSAALRGDSTLHLNITGLYANIGIPHFAEELADCLAEKPSSKYVWTSLHDPFSHLLIECSDKEGFCLPPHKMRHVDKIKNPITLDLIARKSAPVTLDSLRKCKLLGLVAIRIKVLRPDSKRERREGSGRNS